MDKRQQALISRLTRMSYDYNQQLQQLAASDAPPADKKAQLTQISQMIDQQIKLREQIYQLTQDPAEREMRLQAFNNTRHLKRVILEIIQGDDDSLTEFLDAIRQMPVQDQKTSFICETCSPKTTASMQKQLRERLLQRVQAMLTKEQLADLDRRFVIQAQFKTALEVDFRHDEYDEHLYQVGQRIKNDYQHLSDHSMLDDNRTLSSRLVNLQEIVTKHIEQLGDMGDAPGRDKRAQLIKILEVLREQKTTLEQLHQQSRGRMTEEMMNKPLAQLDQKIAILEEMHQRDDDSLDVIVAKIEAKLAGMDDTEDDSLDASKYKSIGLSTKTNENFSLRLRADNSLMRTMQPYLTVKKERIIEACAEDIRLAVLDDALDETAKQEEFTYKEQAMQALFDLKTAKKSQQLHQFLQAVRDGAQQNIALSDMLQIVEDLKQFIHATYP